MFLQHTGIGNRLTIFRRKGSSCEQSQRPGFIRSKLPYLRVGLKRAPVRAESRRGHGLAVAARISLQIEGRVGGRADGGCSQQQQREDGHYV